MSRSSSGKVSASSGSTANLNPSAQPFTPTRVDSSPTSTPVDHGDLAYHRAKAVEAANGAAAQGSRPPGYGPEDHRSSPVEPAAAAAGYSTYNLYAQYFQHTPPGRSSTPGSAGLSAGPFNPTTPPNRHSRPGQADPTPPAHTFSDDGEFYPGTDPRLKNRNRASNSQ
ncbi:hypothetical protein HER10_EVM0003479 [Colletotrichum scovillei]|uniref:uncharacterized protein n=1 Tax=Colletotrichum scovillei TaxID=1209932 RepID=UPI0015C34407|nr:uncharacterized protein HER10_EVM0003479 [Colletotrichum scovillei]KAF4776090.1 hypothetical protein HER10_EVM0003479 [Colletotrichum scovillei]